MKTLLYSLLSICIFQTSLAADLVVELGGTQLVPLHGHSQVWVQDRKVLAAEASGSNLRLKGLREGSSSLKVGPQTYQVQVIQAEKAAAFTELNNQLKNLVGLKAKLDRSRLVVSGRLYRWEDWQTLATLLKDSQVSYVMKAELSQTLQEKVQAHIREQIEKAHLPPQTLIFEPEPEIRVMASEMILKRYEQLLRSYGIQVTKDESSLEIAPTVKVEITVAEVRRDISLNYGLKWPEGYKATIIPDTNTVQGSSLEFNLNALENSGMAKILASPNILCRSGKEAEFLAGGEFPIKILSYKLQDIVWKRYGILLRVKPTADASGRLSLSIETEVSTIDPSKAVDNIPGLLTNRVSSHFDLTKPQTIALSGLIKSEDGKNSSGLPFLARMPIFGALFSSKDFRENRTELVIFVRPSILKEGEDSANPSHLSQYKDKL